MRTRTGLRHAAGGAAFAIIAVSALSGCAGSTVEPAAPTPTETADVTGQIDKPATLKKGWVGVRSDVAMTQCPLEAGPVTAKGTVRNGAEETRDIAILVSWNRPDSTDTVLQLGVTKVDVPAGKTVEWSVSGELPTAAGMCVLNARSGQVKG